MPTPETRCLICGGGYPRTYEEHTGAPKHRAAVEILTGRRPLPPGVCPECGHLSGRMEDHAEDCHAGRRLTGKALADELEAERRGERVR